MNTDLTVKHRRVSIDGVDIFYREAGPREAPAILLPHGYPCSSYQFRNLMPKLADRWRVVAPDFPGCGLSDTPKEFTYSFDGFAEFLNRFSLALGLNQFAIYLHDFGSQIGLRLAINHPEKIAAVIIQNGDIYEDALGPKYARLKEYWDDPTPERYQALRSAINADIFKEEFLNDVDVDIAERIPPDLWELHWHWIKIYALRGDQHRSTKCSLLLDDQSNRIQVIVRISVVLPTRPQNYFMSFS